MEYLADHPLGVGFILVLGIGLFVRLVAKEKHRRDRHLLVRLQAREEEGKEYPA